MFKPRIMTLSGMILMAALSRLIPHPPNFSPIIAMALFGGAHFTRKGIAFVIPLAAMLLSDMFLGFHRLIPVVYGCFALTVLLGMWYQKRQKLAALTCATLTGSVLFFVVTNFSVWAFTPLYPKTFPGLAACFIAAIPFFGNALLGDAIYTAILFGTFAMAAKLIPALRQSDHARCRPRPALATLSMVMILSLFQPTAQATTDKSDAVFISLTRAAEPKNELPTNIAVVTADEIKKSGSQNVNEAIERTTGVQILPTGTLGSTAALRIRGFSTSQILVMINERPIGGVSLGQVNLSQIPVDNIERIEFVRGGASVNYGANAMGGVINIVTKRALEDNPVTDITTEARGFNTRIYRLNFGRKKSLSNGSEFETFVTGSRNLSNGFRQNARHESDSMSAQFGWSNTTAGNFSVELENTNSRIGVPGIIDTDHDFAPDMGTDQLNDSSERQAATPRARQDSKSFATRIEHEFSLGKAKLKTRTFFANSDVSYNDPDTFVDTNPNSFTNGFALYQKQENTSVARAMGLETVGTFGGMWTAGAAYNRDRLDWRDKITVSNSIVSNAGNWGVFGQNQSNFDSQAGGFTFLSGLRYDRHTQFGDTVNPRISVVFKPGHENNGWKLSMNAGRSYRAPTLFEMFAVDPVFKGNPGLKPEVAYTYDIGASKAIGYNHTITATLFRADLKNIIQVKPITFDTSVNLARGYKQGIELETNGAFGNIIRHNVNYTYLTNRAQSDKFISGSTKHNVLSYSPKHIFNYAVETRVPLDIKVGTDFKYVHRRFSGNGETGQRLASYTLWDFKVSRQVLGSNVFLGVHNLLNKRYVDQAGYPQPGRYYSAGITIRFLN